MKKNIAVFGTGYVGIVTAACLADIGHNVTAVDVDRNKIKELKKGYLQIFEPGLKAILKKTTTAGKIHFTNENGSAALKNDVLIVAVGTPSKDDGTVDLYQIRSVFENIIENLESRKTIIIKSTIPPGTVNKLKEQYSAELELTGSSIVFCPEFLREGSAVHDFYFPERIVIGSHDDKALRVVSEIYDPVISKNDVPVLKCSPVSAEMIKYSSNVMLASRIAVMNELAEMSEALGSDIRVISAGVGLDERIGKRFLKSGPGFGGSCFGKDVIGLVKTGEYYGVGLPLINEILISNDRQKLRPALKAEALLNGLRGKKIAVLGLAFKADTDDVRGSAAFNVISYLIEHGAHVKAHDPEAEYNFIREFKKKGYNCVENAEDAVKKADAVIVLTEWSEYACLKPALFSGLMKGRLIIDSRNIYNEELFKAEGLIIAGTGRIPDRAAKSSRGAGELVNAAIVSI